MLGLVILTCTSIPSSIANGGAFPGYVVAIIIIGLGTGGIKSNVAPLVAEQYQTRSPYVKTLKSGERVIVSPQATYQKIFLYFYWVCIKMPCIIVIILLISSTIGYQYWLIVCHCYH